LRDSYSGWATLNMDVDAELLGNNLLANTQFLLAGSVDAM
jgi:hypothetical protein